MRQILRLGLSLLTILALGACGGGAPNDPTTDDTGTAGGEQGAAPDGGVSAPGPEGPAGPDPASASLDEPPPGDPTAPSSLAAIEGLPPEGAVREEARPEGGVRLVAVLPAAPDGNTLLELQTTPGRSGDLASFAVRAVHAAARWADCTTLSLEADGRATALPETRVLTGPAAEGVLETARATGEIREARRLLTATTWRVLACNESFAPGPATRPTLERFFARIDELARTSPATPPAPTKRGPRRH